jgi:hypothetical protein
MCFAQKRIRPLSRAHSVSLSPGVLRAKIKMAPPTYEDLLAENERLRAALRVGGANGASEEEAGDGEKPLPPLAPVLELTQAQVTRYSRQLLVPDFTIEGQKALLSSSVLVIGAGECPLPTFMSPAMASAPWTGYHSSGVR